MEGEDQVVKILSAEMQTHYDRLKLLAKTLRGAKSEGRHDGLGNPIITVTFYQKWVIEACDSIDWILKESSLEDYA